MKTIKRPFVFSLLIIFVSIASASAGSLDDYYLERFGELPRDAAPVAGVVQGEGMAFEKCYTHVYHNLRRDWPLLSTGTQQTLSKYLARDSLAGEATVKSGNGHFLLHYATTGSDAPPLIDTNSNGIPDWVETVAAVFEAVYSREVVEMGYTPPPTVAGRPYDVLLQNLGGGFNKRLGQTDSEDRIAGTSFSSYITIDNDFSPAEFGNSFTPLQYLKITAAHEFHHAIQYGYNYYFDIWYAEATSTWIEDEVFDSVNQLYDYIPAYMNNTRLPLDADVRVSTGGGYGRWVFNRYLTEVKGVGFIRTIWELLRTKPVPANADYTYIISMIPVLDEALGGNLDQYVLGMGRRFVLRNWASHQDEIGLVHTVVPESLSASVSYPTANYSYAFYPQSQPIDQLPPGIAALYLTDSQPGALVLCNNQTGSTVIPPDPSAPLPAVKDAQLSDDIPKTNPDTTISSGKGGGCFIATAAYGSSLHPRVKVLRNFRDRWLLTNAPGRFLVACYYRVSPPLAGYIARHTGMRRISRSLLAPLILTIEHPESPAGMVIGLMTWVLLRRRFLAEG